MSDIDMDDGDDGGIEAGDDDGFVGGEEQQFETDNSPEGLWQQAQDNMGFNDALALSLCIQAYEAEGAEDSLKGQVIAQAIELCSQSGDLEQFSDLLNRFFDARDADYLEDSLLESTLKTVQRNVSTSEDGTHTFLNIAVSRINRENLMNLYLDFRIRQCELSIILGKFPEAKEILKEVQQYCPYPPDHNDIPMCHAAIRILVIQIEFADFENNLEAMFEAYKQAQSLPHEHLDNRQRALLNKIEGLQAMINGRIKEARGKFWEAFRLYDTAGSDKRIGCLPYFGLTTMLLKETVNVFIMPETMHYMQHPLVAPLAQLDEAYQRSDIVLFNNRTKSALEIFKKSGQEQKYTELIDEVRRYVLEKAIMKMCPVYSKVRLEFVATTLQSKTEEVQEIVLDLILSKKLNALVEADSGLLIMLPKVLPSPQLEGLDILVQSSERAVKQFLERTAIRI